jgi:SAM-dependent methyltransferase
MDMSLLVRVIGFPATLFHGDCLVWDRWRWLKRRLPRTKDNLSLIDVGCGTGAFTIGAALRGYNAMGLSWDERNQGVATERAKLCRADHIEFLVHDIRRLDQATQFVGKFDVAFCFETIEHIIDDRKLLADIIKCLRPGGFLLLSTPYYFYRSISPVDDEGPFLNIEDGGHVRRGYTTSMLYELCEQSGFVVEEVSSCSGFFSQKSTALLRWFSRGHPSGHLVGWAITLPLRILPPLLDPLLALHWLA